MNLFRLMPLLAVMACGAPLPPLPSQDRLTAECSLLAQAGAAMTVAGLAVHRGLQEGCPGVSERDARPLPQQSASLRSANTAALPQGVAAGSRAETVFRRMITRGVPVTVAVRLVATEAFASASR